MRLITALTPPNQDAVFFHLVRADGDAAAGSWDFTMPHRLRPCCAFGTGLGVRLGYLPIAGLKLDNIVEAEDLGRHKFNSGMISLQNEPSNAFISPEKNGLVYTCRGGFIDTAHIRDYADWMVFLAVRLRDQLEKGGTIELPEEGGRRYIHVAAIKPEILHRAERDELALLLAQWASIQLAIWHETATWYGWSSWGVFPETASAFSPEDLYSNLVGIMLATALIRADLTSNEAEYNRSMDIAMPEVLRRLRAVPRDATRAALKSVDGRWWDSKRLLPDKEVVLRRHFDIGPQIRPWLLPADGPEAAWQIVREHCDDDRPMPIRYPTRTAGIDLRAVIRFEVELSPTLAARIGVYRPEGPWVSQDDFPTLLQNAYGEARAEFGVRAGHP